MDPAECRLLFSGNPRPAWNTSSGGGGDDIFGAHGDGMAVDQPVGRFYQSHVRFPFGASSEKETEQLAKVVRLSMEAEMSAGKLLERDRESKATVAKHFGLCR